MIKGDGPLSKRVRPLFGEYSDSFRKYSGKTERRGIVARKKEKKIDLANLEPEEMAKYEIAEELGLLDKVLEQGWKSLTSKETGRIGGMVTKRKRSGKDI